MSKGTIDNYLKLVVRAPQTDEERRQGRIGSMITHEIFTCSPLDPDAGLVLHSLFDQAEQARNQGNDAHVSAFDPGPFWHVARAAGETLSRIGAMKDRT
jgi:predicted nicotinamide N-methyase